MYRFIYVLSPKRYKNWVESYIEYCDFKVSSIRLIGFMIGFGLLLGFTVAFLPYIFKMIALRTFFIFWSVGFLAFETIIHGILVMIADSRANFTEEILPDALQIISSNMRSGLTPDKAILTSARPEFGPLEKELRSVAKETLSGKPLEDALRMITKKIKSKVLERTVALLIEGMAKGGSLTTLLDSIAEDIRQIRIIKQEIKSYVMMYGIFIFFAVSIGGPLLYAVSTFLVETMTKFSGVAGIQDTLTASTAIPVFKFKTSQITSSFLMMYSTLSIIVTTIFGSMIIGLIQEGSEKTGLKFVPILLPLGLAVFFLARMALTALFGGLVI